MTITGMHTARQAACGAALFIMAVAAAACGKSGSDIDPIIPVISVETTRISVGPQQQQAAIEYAIVEANASERRQVTAVCDDEWIGQIDCTQENLISFVVEKNDLAVVRSTTLRISYPGAEQVDIAVDQLPVPPQQAEQTLIYYFFGTSLSTFFNYNIEDTKTAISGDILGQSRVLYLKQTSKTEAVICELSYDPIGGTCVEQQLDRIDIPSSQMTSDEVARNLQRIAAIAPARRYGLVAAGHATGWVTKDADTGSAVTFGYRPSGDIWTPAAGAETTRTFGESNVLFDIEEIAAGISSAGVEFDYIVFDACFMSNIEALYDLRDAAHYIIASPCEIMGRGFPYHRTLQYLMQEGGSRSDLSAAAESYWLYYRDEYRGAARCGSVAVIDCSELEGLAATTRDLLATAADVDASTLQTYEGQSPHTFYDFGEFCTAAATDGEALAKFREQLSRCVTAKYTLPTFYSALGTYGTYDIDEEVYSGITTSLPSERYRSALQRTSWYEATH